MNSSLLEPLSELERLRWALKSAQIGTWTLDIRHQQVWWDEHCKQLYGFRNEDFVPYDQVLAYMHPADRLRVDEAVRWALNPQSSGRYDVQFRTLGAQDGQLRWLHCRGRADFDADGIAYRFAGTAQDVTQQVLTHQKLQQSQAHLDLLSNTVPAMIFYLDEQQRYQSCNQTFRDWFGVTDTAVLGKTVQEFVGQQAYARLAPHLALAYNGQTERYEMLAPDRMGQPRWLSIVYTPHLTEGQVVGVIVHATDITPAKRIEQALQASEGRFLSLIQEAPFAIAVYETADFLISIANQAMIELWGKTPAVLGMTLAEALPELEGQPFISLLKVVYETGQTYRTAEQSADLVVDGRLQTYWFNFIYQPLLDEKGQVYGILNMAIDVTERYQAQHRLGISEQSYRDLAGELDNRVQQRTQELLIANQDLQRSNDNLQQFAYVASHDLQEPLRKIQAFSSLLAGQLMGHPDSTIADHLGRIHSAGARMSQLIKALLGYSRIATRQQVFGPVSLNGIVAGVLSTLAGQIQQTEAQIEVNDLPVVNGDELQLGQLFESLLTNALKFVAPGQPPRIQIQYGQRSRSELPPRVQPTAHAAYYHQISVQDEGIGFEGRYVDRVFQVFQRLHGNDPYPGMGVGLAICQRVAENHGGAITADSQPGQGATFCVYLPV